MVKRENSGEEEGETAAEGRDEVFSLVFNLPVKDGDDG